MIWGNAAWLPLAAAVVLLAVAFAVPGGLVASALQPDRPLLERLSLAPAVSVGAAFAVASWCSLLGLRSATTVVTVSLLVITGLAGAVVVHRGVARPRARVRREHLALAGAGMALLMVWVVALATARSGPGGVPPGIDANTHGIMLQRILGLGTLDPHLVTQYDLAAAPGTSSTFFYVLGAHALIAPVAAATSVPAALWAAEILASLWLVLGVFVLARRCGLRRGAPVAAWVSALAVPLLPFSVVFWGGMPLMLGLALVPPVALLAASVRDVRAGALFAVAVSGLLVLHTTELIVVALLAVLALAVDGAPLRSRLADGGRAAAAGGVALVIAAPTVVGLLRGGADRPPDPAEGDAPFDALLRALLEPLLGSPYPAGQPVIAVLLAAGVVLALAGIGAVVLRRSRWGVAVVVTTLVVLALAAAAHVGTLQVLVRPWYGSGERIATQAAALLPVLVAAGIERVLVSARGRRATLVAAMLVAVALVPLAGRSLQLATTGIDRYSVVTRSDDDAYRWLAEHAAPGERVLGSIGDGSTWMYIATDGAVAPLFGAMPSLGFVAHREFDDLVYLRAHVDAVATDSRARAIARAQRVRYVLVGERTFGDGEAPPAFTRLEGAPGLREVFRSGAVRVFQIVGL